MSDDGFTYVQGATYESEQTLRHQVARDIFSEETLSRPEIQTALAYVPPGPESEDMERADEARRMGYSLRLGPFLNTLNHVAFETISAAMMIDDGEELPPKMEQLFLAATVSTIGHLVDKGLLSTQRGTA